MRAKQLWLATLGGALLTVSGCKQPDAPAGGTPAGGGAAAPATVAAARPYSGSDILIGEYGSITGSTASFGTSSRDGISLAVDEANASGGVLGKQIRVQVEDDVGKPEQATTVVKKLIDQDNVLAVIGEVASTRSKAGAQVCQAAQVPMITPTSTNPDVTKVGDYIFRTCFIDPFQGVVNARFATTNLKAKTAAILTDTKSDYSVGLTNFFQQEFVRLGGQVVKTENFQAGGTDFRSQLSNIKGANPDVIFIPGYYTEVGAIAKQARGLGMKMPLLGGDGWDAPELVTIGGDAVQGSYFSSHASPESKDPLMVKFVSSFQAKFGHMPNALAVVAYDAARLMFAAIKKAGVTDRPKIRDAIAATKDFPGVSGKITIDKDRNAVKQVVMLQVKGTAYHYVATVNP